MAAVLLMSNKTCAILQAESLCCPHYMIVLATLGITAFQHPT